MRELELDAAWKEQLGVERKAVEQVRLTLAHAQVGYDLSVVLTQFQMHLSRLMCLRLCV